MLSNKVAYLGWLLSLKIEFRFIISRQRVLLRCPVSSVMIWSKLSISNWELECLPGMYVVHMYGHEWHTKLTILWRAIWSRPGPCPTSWSTPCSRRSSPSTPPGWPTTLDALTGTSPRADRSLRWNWLATSWPLTLHICCTCKMQLLQVSPLIQWRAKLWC